MRCNSITIVAWLLAVAPAAPLGAQVALPTPRAAPPVEAPRIPQPAPRAKRFDMRNDLDMQLELESRQRELMDQQIDRQRELEERQRELEERQVERQQELQERQLDRERELRERLRDRQREVEDRTRERTFERDLTIPEVAPLPPLPATPSVAPLPALEAFAAPDNVRVPESLDGAFLNRRPPAPWAQGDPADSLYRVAREALNRGDYRRAAQLFNELTRRYPSSAYAYVSGYYEAFSRYRIGTTEELQAADRALRALGGRSAPTSGRDDPDVNGLRTRIRGALAMRGDADAADLVAETARHAGTSCDQEDLMVRVEALNALSQMDAAAALPILRRVLERRDECLVELRRRAVFMLARRADAEATALLISTANNDPNTNVRAEAIGYLGRMPGEAGVNALDDILRSVNDERLQRAAVRALMASESPRARTSIRSLLDRKDASEALRVQIIDSYSRERSSQDDASYLRSLYLRTESDRVKAAIIGAVARIGGKDNQDWLLGLVRNTSESTPLRSAALQRLSRSDMPIADLSRMYEAADSRSLREQLISALANRKEPEATDKLIDIAKNSTDPEMRRQAIYSLSRKNDPRATKLLMELIEK